jgi:tetratricopeptide (TPR) repeat protein
MKTGCVYLAAFQIKKMSETKKVTPEDLLVIDESSIIVGKAKNFWEKSSRPILYISGAIILLVAGYYGYQNFYAKPEQIKAADAIWHAQQYFEEDSIQLALNGDGQYPGFEKVAKNFGGTKAGKLAGYYAGLCCLKLKDFNKAVTYLKAFTTDAKEVQAIAYARLADAYSELKKNEEAIEYYVKAAHHFPEQESLSAENLFRAGLLSEVLKKNDDAIKYYKEIKEKYSRTDRGYQVDKYLARLGVVD